MGCSASKQIDGVATNGGKQALRSIPIESKVKLQNGTTSPIKESSHHNIPNGLNNKNTLDKCNAGYSSGASSCGDDDENKSQNGANRPRLDTDKFERSEQTHILDLSNLRKELVADGDLAKTVVRIETPFGKPIEEIYSGVHDGPILGSGVSGVVRLAIHRATGVKYAVKCLDLWLIDSVEGLKQLREEIFIMCQLDHPNIVRIEEVYESTNEIYIVQELCVGGDLFDRLDEQPDFRYTEVKCARLVKQMLSSVRYLHSKGIIHRDLKLENFLFSSTKDDSQLKMIDFGLSKHFELGQQFDQKVGTPYTVAPEIIVGDYDEKCDLWSIGVITYLILCGETPFGGLDGESLLDVRQKIINAKVYFKPEDIWENVSEDGKVFVKLLLDPDPTTRPSAKQAQRNDWIRIYSKKDVTETKLKNRTVSALRAFKENSDMQKLLSEVLSFTLLPEQIEELRDDFEKIDHEGVGEISLKALKRVLIENAEVGALGSLTELEVEELFDSIKLRKTEPTIRWHEFLAAGLSQARVDDRNLRLAFERLDSERKGFVTFHDLHLILGTSTGYVELEKMWLDSLQECKTQLDRINFSDFKMIMKGQPKDKHGKRQGSSLSGIFGLAVVPEGDKPIVDNSASFKGIEELAEDEYMNVRTLQKKKRSQSFEQNTSMWQDSESGLAARVLLLSEASKEAKSIDPSLTPLVANRALYRKHREMRISVLDASKQFDKKRDAIQNMGVAALIMKRGAKPPMELEDTHTRALFHEAHKRCGRSRRSKNKTVSDITGMLAKADALELS